VQIFAVDDRWPQGSDVPAGLFQHSDAQTGVDLQPRVFCT
jgi:hypothetical protein